MEFRNLYSFLRVAEMGSFTKAAEDMGYAQSTVTTQVQQLEAEIGVPLFERIGKKNVLTVHGQHLITYANQVMQVVEQMKCLGQAELQDVRGSIRIGMVESLMSSLLLAVIGRYREQYPHVSVQIRMAVTEPLFDLLRHNEVDIIFTIGENVEARDCIRACSHPQRAVFVAAQKHPLARRRHIPLREVLDYPLILTGPSTYLHQELNRIAFQCGKEISSYIETDSSKIIVDLVNQNLGLSFLPEYLVRFASLKYELAILPVDEFSMTLYSHIFYHKNKWITPQMLGLIKLTEEYWAEENGAESHTDAIEP